MVAKNTKNILNFVFFLIFDILWILKKITKIILFNCIYVRCVQKISFPPSWLFKFPSQTFGNQKTKFVAEKVPSPTNFFSRQILIAKSTNLATNFFWLLKINFRRRKIWSPKNMWPSATKFVVSQEKYTTFYDQLIFWSPKYNLLRPIIFGRQKQWSFATNKYLAAKCHFFATKIFLVGKSGRKICKFL